MSFDPKNPDTFEGKVCLNAIDKLLIGGIAAIMLIIFQCNAHEYQLRQDAAMSVSKIYTGIILKQREEIIELMSKYFLLIEEIKSGKVLNDSEKEEVKEYLYRVRFMIYTLCSVIPNNIADKVKNKIKNDTDSFGKEISAMNLFLLWKKEPSLKEIDAKVKLLNDKYRNLLETLRYMSIEIVYNEMKSVH